MEKLICFFKGHDWRWTNDYMGGDTFIINEWPYCQRCGWEDGPMIWIWTLPIIWVSVRDAVISVLPVRVYERLFNDD